MCEAVLMTTVVDGSKQAARETLPSRLPWMIVWLIVMAGVIARGWLLFSTPLMPGVNGAYYLVQSRSVIEHLKLGIPDLPLVFCVQALLATVIRSCSGMSLDSSVILAVKFEDAVFPAMVAIPVFALVRRWAMRNGGGLWLPVCAALAVAAGAPALRMVGDFEKNSLALVWLAALLWSLHGWLEQPTTRRAILPVLFLTLTGLTHIGVFGWALVLSGLAVTVAIWRCPATTRRLLLPWLFTGIVACLSAAAIVLWKFDSARVQRLGTALAHPLSYLSQNQAGQSSIPGASQPPGFGNMPGNGPGNMPGGGNHFGLPGMGGPGPGQPNGFAGGPPGMMMGRNSWIGSGGLLIAGAAALAMVGFRRKQLTVGDVAIITGCAIGLIVLSGPWVTGDKVMRFQLIAVGPAVICAAFALAQLPWSIARNTLAIAAVLALVAPGVMLVRRGGHPVITVEAASELREMAVQLPAPDKTLIVARHGLEWWTAWYLHTHIAHMNAVSDDDWKNFDQVYFLRQNSGMAMGPGMGSGPGRRRPDGQGGFVGGGFPGSPPGGLNGRPPGPGGGAFGEPMIPFNADITHDGKYFTLALVTNPVTLPGRAGSFAGGPRPAGAPNFDERQGPFTR